MIGQYTGNSKIPSSSIENSKIFNANGYSKKDAEQKAAALILKKIGSIQDFNDYELFVDEKKWRISKMILRQNQEPKKIEGKFFYARKAGKWVVEETHSIFKVNSQKYIEKTKYKYKNGN